MTESDKRKLLKRYYALECIRYLLSMDFNYAHTLRDIFKLVEHQPRFKHVQQSDELDILAAELEHKLYGVNRKRNPGAGNA